MNMSKVIETNRAFLELLASTKSDEQRQALLETATPGQVRAISEITLNLLNRRSKQPDEHVRKKINNNIKFYRTLAKSNRPFARKRQKLISTHQREVDTNQTGDGIFSILLPILTGTLFGGLGSKS